MAFTEAEIEDGTGKPGAVVFATTVAPVTSPVDEAAAYLVRRGKTKFSTAGALQEQRLIQATEYVEQLAHDRVQGHPRIHLQALLQPRRSQVVDHSLLPSDEIPVDWLRAVWEAAELAAGGAEFFDVVDSDRNLKREQTGRSLEQEWFQAGSRTSLKVYHAVLKLLEPILEPTGQLARA